MQTFVQQRNGVDRNVMVVRASAVIIILVCHLYEIYGSAVAWWLNAGVQIFLFVSGFVFGSRTIRDWRGWFSKRVLRILPPYYVLVGAVVLANLLLARQAPHGKELAATLLGVQDFLKVHLPGCDHLWFITLILVCYLTVPGLQWLRDRQTGPAARVAIGLLGLPVVFYIGYKAFNFLTYAYVANLTAFAWGYGYGSLRERPAAGERQIPWERVALLITALLLAGRGLVEYYGLSHAGHWAGIYDKLLLPWSKVGVAASFFFMVRSLGWTGEPNRVLRFIDTHSYEIYLTHHIFIFGPLSVIPLIHSKTLAVAAVAALTVIASIALRKSVQWMSAAARWWVNAEAGTGTEGSLSARMDNMDTMDRMDGMDELGNYQSS